jgi:glycerol uptake facilitator-like aquaporin
VKKYFAEFIGTSNLVLAVVGSGYMATNLSIDVGLRLLINALATALTLGVLIQIFIHVSGSHFNPIVTLLALIKSRIKRREAIQYILAQLCGGIFGVILANLMFSATPITISSTNRSGFGLYLGEVIATAGLIFIAFNPMARSEVMIPAWIASAYFFTSSTAFANPAVTLARSFTDSFSGIAPTSVFGFIVAQIIGGVLGFTLIKQFEVVK